MLRFWSEGLRNFWCIPTLEWLQAKTGIAAPKINTQNAAPYETELFTGYKLSNHDEQDTNDKSDRRTTKTSTKVPLLVLGSDADVIQMVLGYRNETNKYRCVKVLPTELLRSKTDRLPSQR